MTDFKLPTPQEFYVQLNRHDWYYEYSDDINVWRRGGEREGRLRMIAAKDPKLQELYDGFRKHYFSGESFGTEQHPKPHLPEG